MQIQLESSDKNTILSYTDQQIIIDGTAYEKSLLIAAHTIISPWNICSIKEMNELLLEPALTLDPEIILIGHQQLGQQLPFSILELLSKKRIGIECMSVGAACRTFNVLLAEQRRVILGVIFKPAA